MTAPDERPAQHVPLPTERGGSYSLHPVSMLDGVMIYVSLNGETVGFYSGKTEREAAAAVVGDLVQAAATPEGGQDR